MRARLLAVWLLWLSVSVSAGLAHPVPFSYIDINITPRGTDLWVSMHAFDVAHDLGLLSETQTFGASFVEQQGGPLTTLIMSRLQIQFDQVVVPPVPVGGHGW